MTSKTGITRYIIKVAKHKTEINLPVKRQRSASFQLKFQLKEKMVSLLQLQLLFIGINLQGNSSVKSDFITIGLSVICLKRHHRYLFVTRGTDFTFSWKRSTQQNVIALKERGALLLREKRNFQKTLRHKVSYIVKVESQLTVLLFIRTRLVFII